MGVPIYPGVPALARSANSAVASNSVLSVVLGTVENVLLDGLQGQPQWGIFDSDGNQIGIDSGSQSILSAVSGSLLSQLTGSTSAVQSTFSVDFIRETKVSEFQVEGGSFASYNKVQMSATPTVTLILEGSSSDRAYLLDALEDACASTDLYSVVTPDYTYSGYTIERFSYARTAQRGATLLMVEVVLKEIRQVTSSKTNVSISSPQDASATEESNNGIEQSSAPSASTLSKASGGISKTISSFFGGGD